MEKVRQRIQPPMTRITRMGASTIIYAPIRVIRVIGGWIPVPLQARMAFVPAIRLLIGISEPKKARFIERGANELKT